MVIGSDFEDKFRRRLDALRLQEASDLLQQEEGKELKRNLLEAATSSPDRLLQEPALMELVLRTSESLTYRGEAESAHQLLNPYTEKPMDFVKLSRGIPMRWRLQVGECLYSQRNLSSAYLPRAQDVAQALHDSCRDEERELERGQVYYFFMRLEHRKGNYDEMGTQAMKAVDAITQFDTQSGGELDMTKRRRDIPWWLGRTLLEYGIAAWRHGESERAAARLQLARWLLQYVPKDLLNHARVHHSIGALYHAQGGQDKENDARTLLDQAKAGYERLGHALNLSRIHCALGRFSLSKNDYKAAENYFEEAMKNADKYGSKMQRAEVHVWKGWCRYEQEQRASQLNLAIEDGLQAIELLEGMQAYHIYVDAYLMMGHSYLKKGDTGRAEAEFGKALKTAREHRLQKHVLNAQLSLGEVARERNNRTEAIGYYQSAMNGFPDGKLPFSQYLDKKAKALKNWLYSNDLAVFTRTAEDVRGRKDKKLEDYRSEFDGWLIRQVYEEEGRHVVATAERLGIPRQRVSKILNDSKTRPIRRWQRRPKDANEKEGTP